MRCDALFTDSPIDRPVIVSGHGCYVEDSEGRKYLDAVGGAHVVTIGHAVSEVYDDIRNQACRVSYIGTRHFYSRPQILLAEHLISRAPAGVEKVAFLSTGSEAVEVALRMSYFYQRRIGRPERSLVVGLDISYHGSTVGALSIGGHPSRVEMLPYLAESPRIPSPYCYRCPLSLEYPTCDLACAETLRGVLNGPNGNRIGAFIAESVGGTTGGAIRPPNGYFERIRSICTEFDVLFIADEILCGLGRTGREWAIDHSDVSPDLMVASKGLASGYAAISAILIHERVVEVLREVTDERFVRSTYSGSPLACATALSVQRYVMSNGLVDHCDASGLYLRNRLEQLRIRQPLIGDVRGQGLLLAIELVRDAPSRTSFPRSAKFYERVVQEALVRGMILLGGSIAGLDTDHLMITPPYVISSEECDELVAVLDLALEAAAQQVS
jgi:adenosylmethionine-8-amino-7-oxononanoate aminotransferase